MENNISKNYLVILLPYFLFAQAIFVFYKLIPILLTYYQPEAIFLFSWGSAALGGILAILTGVGILLKKKWSIISYCIFAVFSILITFLLSQVVGIVAIIKLPGIGEFWLIVINIIFAVYLLFSEWKKWGKS